MNTFKILIVEDDPPVQNLISTMLDLQGYKYDIACSGQDALMECGFHQPDLILMDLGLPDLDGIEVIKKIRSWSAVPILVISARSQEKDKIEALDAGADDYITKPFSVEEMLARIRAMQRRNAILKAQNVISGPSPVYENGDLKIDYLGNEVYFKGNPLHLTPIEYKLLTLFSQNTGKVLTTTYITREIWGSAWQSDMTSLRVYMANLRKKLKSEDGFNYIQTRIGVGYKMVRKLDDVQDEDED